MHYIAQPNSLLDKLARKEIKLYAELIKKRFLLRFNIDKNDIKTITHTSLHNENSTP